jgi:hydrogenase assembly chaperone HypC/HupF
MPCALAIPGKVEEITEENGLRVGRVNFGGVIKRVCLDYVPEVEVGDYTIVHVGFALSKIDEDEAVRTLEVFRQMGVLDEELGGRGRGVCTSLDGAADAVSRRELLQQMKYLTEFRNGEIAQRMAREIAAITTRPWKIMEVCGGQTHSIIKNGIDQMLPAGIEMIHGPGCPVCVTPLELIDKALAIAAQPGVIFCSFGDMLRVPGTDMDLFQVKGAGGDVRVVYSPLDAVELAAKNPDRQVVFFGVGFETTAPANAMSVHVAKRRGLKNFSLLVSHVLVPPAISAIMSSPGNKVQAFLLAGHVCSVMGYWEYPPIAEKFGIPLVVTGFEPLDLLDGIRRAWCNWRRKTRSGECLRAHCDL